MSCGACVTVCADGALTMEPMDAHDLVVPDKLAEEVALKKAQAKTEVAKYLEQGKKQLNRAADALERLDGSDTAAGESAATVAKKE